MRNLTSSTIVLFPAGGAAPIVLPPSRAVTTKQMQEMLILKGEMIDVGARAMDSATLKTPARTKDEAQARSTTQTPRTRVRRRPETRQEEHTVESTRTTLRDSGRWALGATTKRIWKAAEKLGDRLQEGSVLTSHALRKAMNEVSDASYAGHQWNWREAYDAAEVAINLRVLAATNRATSAAEGGRRAIEAALGLARLETPQTQRAQATDGLQQFSTPIEIAIAVIEAARIRAEDTVLEPSAGTGVLATLAAAHLDDTAGDCRSTRSIPNARYFCAGCSARTSARKTPRRSVRRTRARSRRSSS